MSILTAAWAACAAASLMLGLMHLLLWFQAERNRAFLLSSLMAFSAGFNAMIELNMLHARSPALYAELVRWENLAVFLILVPMVWFVDAYFRTGRRWLLYAITLIWSVGIAVNFALPGNLTFAEIQGLSRFTTFWGEQFSVPRGTAGAWKPLADFASFLIVVYVADASIRLIRKGEVRKAGTVGGSILLFILLAGIHSPLVDAGLVATPYMVSFAFLAIVVAMSYELVSGTIKAGRLAKEINAKEKRWRMLLDNIQLAVLGIGTDGRINFANPFLVDLSGYGRAELLGSPVTLLATDTERAEMEYRLARAAEMPQRPHSRWTLVCASGEQRTLDWSMVRLEASGDGFLGLVAVGADITDQLKAQKDLQQTQRELNRLARANLLGELASTLAHELNQPLAAILSNAQAARRFMASGALDLKELRYILDDIVSDDKRASEIIRHLRSMLQRGDIPRAAVDVNDAVREVLELLDGELRDNHVSLIVHYSPELPVVSGARVEVQQVIMNLLLNSVKALHGVPAGDRAIEIRTCTDGDNVLVSVNDTGPGIPSKNRPKIFDAFYSTTEDGIGMGLAICKRIVENHGGEISAENSDSGSAVMSFSLPALR